MPRSCFRMSRSSSELVRDILEFFDSFLFLFVILARNIDYKSTLQKTLKQFGLVASKGAKIEIQEQFSVRLTSQTSLLMSRDMFLQSAFQFGFLPSKPCLFPLKSSLEFVLHRGKPKFISSPDKFPADRSKFEFCTTARSLI